MRILYCDAYHAGSHAAFAHGWQERSQHDIELLTLPGRHWKWRLRQAAPAFAQLIREQGSDWDALICTSMCNLAELRGLLPRRLAGLPAVVYMHENQAAYPDRHPDARDLHYPLIQLVSCLSADAIWWNSAWNRDSFLDGCQALLKHMPEQNWPGGWQEHIRERSTIQAPGIDVDAIPGATPDNSPPHICWAARWEHDKDPETFFAAIDRLADHGRDFQLSVLGESFREVPACFAAARERHAARIRHWGYQGSRDAYLRCLAEADIFVSTAKHEFFGIAAVEAACAGCTPLLPRILAYPEVFSDTACYHDGSVDDLANQLNALLTTRATGGKAQDLCRSRYAIAGRITAMDDAIEKVKLRP